MKKRICLLSLGVSLVLVSGPAFASFGAVTPSTSSSFTTATLVEPAALLVEAVCRAGAADVDLSWTRSESSFATGYDVLRSDNLGDASISSVDGGDTLKFTDASVGTGRTLDYWVRSTAGNWESEWSQKQTVITPSSCP